MKAIVDTSAAYELELYTINTGYIYRTYTVPTIKNLQRKIKKRKYNREKALKSWEHIAEAAAKEYAREFASPTAWHAIFNAATRRAVAVELAEYYDEHIQEG